MSKNTEVKNEILEEIINIARARKKIVDIIRRQNTSSGLETSHASILININEDAKNRENQESIVLDYNKTFDDIVIERNKRGSSDPILSIDGSDTDRLLKAYDCKWTEIEIMESMLHTGLCKVSSNADAVIKAIIKNPEITRDNFFLAKIDCIKKTKSDSPELARQAVNDLGERYKIK